MILGLNVLEMELSQEQIEIVEKLAAINYTVRQIAMYFDFAVAELMLEYDDKDSVFRYHYDRGKLMAQADVDMKQLENAKGGNQSAMQQIEKIRNSRHFETTRDQLIYGN